MTNNKSISSLSIIWTCVFTLIGICSVSAQETNENGSNVNESDPLVWPGDANNDGWANHMDFIYIIDALEFTGSPRANATIEWVGQPAADWHNENPAGVNYKHFDTDGNGKIHLSDLAALFFNYGLTHGVPAIYGNGSSNDMPFYFDFDTETVEEGQPVEVPLILGSATQTFPPIDHLAFRIPLDLTLIDTFSVYFEFEPSWFSSNPEMEEILYSYDIENGFFDVAFGRINSTPAIGSGPIGSLRFVMEENIAGRPESNTFLSLQPIDVLALTNSQVSFPIFTHEDSIEVVEFVHVDLIDKLSPISIYPNPNNGTFFIHTPEEEHEGFLSVYSLHGELIAIKELNSSTVQKVHFADVPAGPYFIQLKTSNDIFHQKIIIH